MKRAFLCTCVLVPLLLAGCGKSEENNASTNNTNAATNNTNAATNSTTGTNSGTNSTTAAPECVWGAFMATCGGGPERDLSARAVGCTEYYEPTPAGMVDQELLCDAIWDDMNTCSQEGLSGRRPVGCCWEHDETNELYSRHCFYDDPANLEASGEIARTACESAGFCWIEPESM